MTVRLTTFAIRTNLVKQQKIDKTSKSVDYSSDSSNEQQLERDDEIDDRLSEDEASVENEEPKKNKRAAIQLGFASAFAKVKQSFCPTTFLLKVH